MSADEIRHVPPAGLFGRIARIIAGLLLLGSIGAFYLGGSGAFVLRSTAVAVGLAGLYWLLHRRLAAGGSRLGFLSGSCLAFVPLLVVWGLGVGGGAIFGSGEGQLGALTFLGVSLVLAGLRGDAGCEVMAVPNALAGKPSALACLVFTPIDRLERQRSRTTQFGEERR